MGLVRPAGAWVHESVASQWRVVAGKHQETAAVESEGAGSSRGVAVAIQKGERAASLNWMGKEVV